MKVAAVFLSFVIAFVAAASYIPSFGQSGLNIQNPLGNDPYGQLRNLPSGFPSQIPSQFSQYAQPFSPFQSQIPYAPQLQSLGGAIPGGLGGINLE